MNKLSRLFYTLIYLKPTQLAFFILRRKFQAKKVRVDDAITKSFSSGARIELSIPVQGGLKAKGEFEYLNQYATMEDEVDWSARALPRLWGYNLHYFDYLRNDQVDDSYRFSLIESWINANKENSQPGWEPFTCSLRIVNWLSFLSRFPEYQASKVLDSLYHQVMWLELNDERHILANHYFENLKALLFAGVFFQGADADRWRKKATAELKAQLKEQTLDDGGHYERSPQYHSLMLENYLDIYNLVSSNSNYFQIDFTELLKHTAERGLHFLRDIVFPDGEIPLLNDSAFGSAPTLVQLEAYARRLFNFEPRAVPDSIINKPDFGLYGLRRGADMLVLDCGDIGPSYQPGHTHCDFLSFELMKSGQRIIVDTGVSEYEPGESRRYLRSTQAHNTVVVNGLEQSEVWGEFRVARRAKKRSATILEDEAGAQLQASFDGFYASSWRRRPSFSHARKMDVKLLKDAICSINVTDTICSIRSPNEAVYAESYIHFHPDIDILEAGLGSMGPSKSFSITSGGKEIAILAVDARFETQLRETIYCPEFGKKDKNLCLLIAAKELGDLEFGYKLVFT